MIIDGGNGGEGDNRRDRGMGLLILKRYNHFREY